MHQRDDGPRQAEPVKLAEDAAPVMQFFAMPTTVVVASKAAAGTPGKGVMARVKKIFALCPIFITEGNDADLS